MTDINEELKAIEAASAVLSTNANSEATIRVLRQAKYIAALAMTTLPSDKALNDARHAFVTTFSDLVKALETVTNALAGFLLARELLEVLSNAKSPLHC